MILYFSATGNTRLIAEALAHELNDECVSLLQRIRESDYSDIHSRNPFIFCAPVYVSELPVFFSEYLQKVSLTGCGVVYGILTNGGYSGIAGGQMKKIIEEKGLTFRGYAEFKLASNHITNKSHKPSGEDEIVHRIRTSLSGIPQTAVTIRNGGHFRNRHLFLLEYAVTIPVAPVLCYFNQGTAGFRVKENCISCGKCAGLCPMNVIRMEDHKPVWDIPRCAHCMSCIQNCPVQAIEYKDVTEWRKRYNASAYIQKAAANGL